MDLDKAEEKHPSFGVIHFSRSSCMPPRSLFGSSTKHTHLISFSVQRATQRRDLSNTWIHGGETLIEGEMSPAQFADMITSMNVGSGTPLTLTRVAGKAMERCTAVSDRQKIEHEFKAEMDGISARLDELVTKAIALQAKASVTKADRQEFVDMADSIRCKVAHSLPFIQGQFNEAMDKTVSEAKSEVESFLSGAIRNAGLESLRSGAAQVPLLVGPGEGVVAAT